MSAGSLDHFFKRACVAVAGASDDACSIGFQVMRNLVTSGGARVYPVNIKRRAVQEQEAFTQVRLLPEKPDLDILCTGLSPY